MENFAEYFLSQEDYIERVTILFYAQKHNNIFFDSSVIFKTELARMFLNKKKIDVDYDLVINTSLLFACKRHIDPSNLEKVKTYAKEGAEYLSLLGFSDKFCKVCQEVNRYSKLGEREPESDVIELVDNFGGMLLTRSDRRGFPIDEALTLLETRNLKGCDNRFLQEFNEFVSETEETSKKKAMTDDLFLGEIASLNQLTEQYREMPELHKYITIVSKNVNEKISYQELYKKYRGEKEIPDVRKLNSKGFKLEDFV